MLFRVANTLLKLSEYIRGDVYKRQPVYSILSYMKAANAEDEPGRYPMDAIDIKILNCLKTNSRQNASAISEQINLSVSAVIERIRKMESNGIIKQYTVVLNSAQTGNDMSAFISVSIEHPKYHQNFMDKVTGMPNIRAVSYTHLDVYKRQVSIPSPLLSRRFLSGNAVGVYPLSHIYAPAVHQGCDFPPVSGFGKL